ncbi:MAG: SMC-Scp complex subunit ScpB, partial [Candidatus Riflebacteria bacterium]|nr:SMC-Scp complex subunit ScpB [Candidatus Riflebacteria bacterium]
DLEMASDAENEQDLNNLDGVNESEKISVDGNLFDEAPIADYDSLCAALDGILLVNSKPITYEKLSQVLGIPIEKAEQLVLSRKKDFDDDPKCGIQIAVLENGVQFATKAKISQFIQRLDGQKLVSLSLPALETLSVIAFKQPITKAEIDAIRGVNSEGVVNTLLEKKLIYISGEKQVLGKPRLYSTTQDFLYYFGMNSLKELPVPTIDINEALASEAQNQELIEQQKVAEKDFNTSQGFVPIEDKNNDLGEVSENETTASEVTEEAVEDLSNSDLDEQINDDTEPQNTGE